MRELRIWDALVGLGFTLPPSPEFSALNTARVFLPTRHRSRQAAVAPDSPNASSRSEAPLYRLPKKVGPRQNDTKHEWRQHCASTVKNPSSYSKLSRLNEAQAHKNRAAILRLSVARHKSRSDTKKTKQPRHQRALR